MSIYPFSYVLQHHCKTKHMLYVFPYVSIYHLVISENREDEEKKKKKKIDKASHKITKTLFISSYYFSHTSK